jgi:hypothetical protein
MTIDLLSYFNICYSELMKPDSKFQCFEFTRGTWREINTQYFAYPAAYYTNKDQTLQKDKRSDYGQ